MRNNFLYNRDFNNLPEKMRQGDIGAVVETITDFYMDHYSLPTDCSREPEDGVYDDEGEYENEN